MGTKQTADELIKQARGLSINGKNIRIDFVYQSKRCRETLKLPVTPANIKFAIRKREAILHEIAVGTFDYRQHFPESKMADKFGSKKQSVGITLSEMAGKYKKLKEPTLGIQTVRNFNNRIDQCVKAIGEDVLVNVLRPEHILDMRNQLITSRSASTVNVYISDFRAFLQYLNENQYIDQELSKHCKRFKRDQAEPEPFEEHEIKRILNACQHETSRNIITLAVYTGLRTGELCALAWEDVNLEQEYIEINRNITLDREFKLPKTDEKRKVYLTQPAINALKKQREHTLLMTPVDIEVHQRDKRKKLKQSVKPVFRPGLGATVGRSEAHAWYTANTLSSIWRMIIQRSGVRYRRIYQLRHTYACWCLTHHGNIAYIAKQMGHKDYTMLSKIYGRWMDSSSISETRAIWSRMKGAPE